MARRIRKFRRIAPADQFGGDGSGEAVPAHRADLGRVAGHAAIAARHVVDLGGWAAASSTAGHTHSSRSRSCCRAAVASTNWSLQRAPTWRSRHQSPSSA